MIYLLKIRYSHTHYLKYDYEEFDSVDELVEFMHKYSHEIASYTLRELHAIPCPTACKEKADE